MPAARVVGAFVLDLLLALVAFVAVAACVGLLALAFGHALDDGAEDLASLVGLSLAMMAAALAPYLLRRRATGAVVSGARAALARGSTLGWMVATLATLLALSLGLEWLDAWRGLGLEASNEQPIAALLGTAPLATVVYVVLLAPVFEELLFRRVLFGRFLAAGRPGLGYVLTGALFASLHEFAGLSTGDALQTALLWMLYFAMAVGLAWVYRRTGSLWAPVLVHMANNALGLWLMLGG